MARIDVIMPQMGESIAEGTLSQLAEEGRRRSQARRAHLRDLHRQGGRRDPLALRRACWRKSWCRRARPWRCRPSWPGSRPRRARPRRLPARRPPRPAAPAPAPAPAAAAAPRPAGAATRRSRRPPRRARPGRCRPARPNPKRREERLRRRSTPLVRKMAAEHNLDLARHPGHRPRRPGHQERCPQLSRNRPAASPRRRPGTARRGPAARGPQRRTPAGRALARRPGGAVVADPQAHRRPHGHVAAGLAPREQLFEVDYTRDRPAPGPDEEGIRRARGEPDLPGLHRQGGGRQPPEASGGQRGRHAASAPSSGGEINLGIAVALDWGLIVPVIKRADELSLLGVARAISDLAERARGKKLSPDEVQRGTFTITNPGVFGCVIGFAHHQSAPGGDPRASGPSRSSPPVVTLPTAPIAWRSATRGHDLHGLRSPDRRRRRRRPVHGRRQEDAPGVPGAQRLRWPGRSAVPRPSGSRARGRVSGRPCRRSAALLVRGGQHIWVLPQHRRPRLFLEFSESPTPRPPAPGVAHAG